MSASNQGTELLLSIEDETKETILRLLSSCSTIDVKKREEIASQVSSSLTDFLSLYWGGQQIYIPMDNKRRASMMFTEYNNGMSHADIARKFNVCVQTVYKAIKRETETRQQQGLQQGSLL